MKMTFRWYPDENAVDLWYVKQIPSVTGIVGEISAPVGDVWPLEKILQLKKMVNSHDLELEVIESVKVHEDIKLGLPTKDLYIDNYIKTLENLAAAGIKVVCYDFMPVFDWMRTQTDKVLSDRSTALVYYKEQIEKMNPLEDNFALCDWEAVYSKDELKRLFELYSGVNEEKLWDNLEYFLKRIIPHAEKLGIYMGMHPDDPSWSIFGLPRIITNERNIDRLLTTVNSKYNSLTLCSGSIGCNKDNDIVAMVRKYAGAGRVAFGHIRNVKLIGEGSFEESAHYSSCGSLDCVEILKAYYEAGFTGYIRPDHGRMIWGEKGPAGYGLYDRALGAVYLSGIWETLQKTYIK